MTDLRSPRVARRLLGAALAPLLGACYSYTAIESSEIRPSLDVRLRITAGASERVAPLLGSANTRVIAGTVVDTTNGNLIVEVPTVSQVEAGGFVQTLHQRVALTRGDVLLVESRTLDRVRTGALAGSAALVLGGAGIKAFRSESGKDKGPGGNETDALVPLARRLP